MYSTLSEFHNDIKKVENLLDAIQSLKEFGGHECEKDLGYDSNTFIEQSFIVHNLARENHSNLVLLSGILVLFIAGRFESFVRITFEELCINCSNTAEKFNHLPKEMRESLIRYTAEVISNPRKYGHGDLGIKAFIKTLASNLSDEETLSAINYPCISITTENMRSQVMADLFKRIGIKNIWDTIGEQAKLKKYLEIHESAKARSEAEKFLNEFMDIRNKIAHPSSSFTWPDIEFVRRSVKFFGALSSVLIDAVEVQEIQLREKIKSAIGNN